FVIMPNQRIVVADLKAGRVPDAKYGKIAKLRSTHNNYLTLPVIFLMLSSHYPLAIGTDNAWIIAALVFLMGVTIRHFFNTMHLRQPRPDWTWAATAVIFVALIWLSTAPLFDTYEEAEARDLTVQEQRFASAGGFEDAVDVVLGNCSMCHAREPVWPGMYWAPKGVHLETEADIAHHAKQIYLQAGVSHAMPPAILGRMAAEDQAVLVRWYLDGRDG
ncbi:MAG: urate hydroxylase PuuD, partial [Pseudomonadota bacterium]